MGWINTALGSNFQEVDTFLYEELSPSYSIYQGIISGLGRRDELLRAFEFAFLLDFSHYHCHQVQSNAFFKNFGDNPSVSFLLFLHDKFAQ